MAIDTQKFLPQGNKGGSITISRPKFSLVKDLPKDLSPVEKKLDSKESGGSSLVVIKTRVVEIEKILKGSVALDKKLQDRERREREKELRNIEETELEEKDDADKKVKKKKTKAKLSFLDGLIKYLKDLLMGSILFRMLDNLPQLKKIAAIIGNVIDFITINAIRLVDALGTFLLWGDKAISGSRNFIKDKFGEGAAENFDKVIDGISKVFNTIATLGLVALAIGNEVGRQNRNTRGRNLGSTRRGFNPRQLTKTRGNAAIRRYARKYGVDAARRRFGNEAIKNLGGKFTRSAGTNLVRNLTTKTLGKTGTRQLLKFSKKFISPIVKRIPIIGALMDFALNYFVFKEPIGRAAFKAIGAGIGLWIGGALGTLIPVPFVGTAIGSFLGGAGGDALGGVIYDAVFGGKEAEKIKSDNSEKIKSDNDVAKYTSYEDGGEGGGTFSDVKAEPNLGTFTGDGYMKEFEGSVEFNAGADDPYESLYEGG